MEVIQAQLDESQKADTNPTLLNRAAQIALQQQEKRGAIRPTSALLRQPNPASLVAPQPS